MIAFFDMFPHLDMIDLDSVKFLTLEKIRVLLNRNVAGLPKIFCRKCLQFFLGF